MAVISGQKRQYVNEIKNDGVITESEFLPRLTTNILDPNIIQNIYDQLTALGAFSGSGGNDNLVYDGGSPTTGSGSGIFKIDFGGVN